MIYTATPSPEAPGRSAQRYKDVCSTAPETLALALVRLCSHLANFLVCAPLIADARPSIARCEPGGEGEGWCGVFVEFWCRA